jgi:glycosyltransferase involved in cell wall biosynthesis
VFEHGLDVKLVIVSTALPRRCGLATFTDDLRVMLQVETGWDISVCAIDKDGLRYGDEVLTVVRQDDAEDYRRAARVIASAGTDLVVIQHEFGIFGGPDGAHILELADELRMCGVRYVATLHTVLSSPSLHQRAVLSALGAGAARVTVFACEGERLVVAAGIASAERVAVVAHGAPAVLRSLVGHDRLSAPVAEAIRSLGRARVVMTFGLVGPGKGLEHGIEALAMVAERHPGTHYLIAGATHPEVIRRHGESYRRSLERLADDLGVAEQVRFLDVFLTEQELSAVLRRADVFLTPYRSPEQICSGALTFALAAGRPVVSTAYRYAEEMLAADEHGVAPGIVVPCGDVEAMAEAIGGLLANPQALAAAREAADRLGAKLIWPEVARRFASVLRGASPVHPKEMRIHHRLRLDHLERLTDCRGIIQFAHGREPDTESGYCVDDVARLGIVAAVLARQDWLDLCLGFLEEATASTGMHNLMLYSGQWSDAPHLGDHVGRALWAAGVMVSESGVPESSRIRALRFMRRMVRLLDATASPRSIAYGLLGLTRWPALEFDLSLWVAATRLEAAGGAGPWFEQFLTYDNARLPQALLAAGVRLDNQDMVKRALSTLDWYLERVGLCGDEPVLRLVGNGWRDHSHPVSAREGDEQPLDAAATVEALIDAWQHTGRRRYAELALRAFAWFHGVNRAGTALYDPASGGCRDGMSATAANTNQGAESTLAYLQALLALDRAGLVSLQAPRQAAPARRSAEPRPSPRRSRRHRSTSEARR